MTLFARPDAVARLTDPDDPLARLLFRDSTAAMALLGADLRVLHANAALRRITALPDEPEPPATTVFDPAAAPTVIAALRPVLDGLLPYLDMPDVPLAWREDDADHGASLHARGIRNKAGVVVALLLTVTDETARRRMQSQLDQAQKLEAIGRLTGGIAHDFNNLLTAVIGAADMIASRAALDPMTQEDVAQIRASAGRGAGLVRQLLAFAGQQALRPRVLRLNDSVRDVSSLLRRLLGASVRLDLSLEEPGRLVSIDPTQLDQVVVNLLVNARDAMPKGGRVTLRTGHVALLRPAVHGADTIPPGRYVLIEVEDEGVGIPPRVLSRIFEPFFTTRQDQGGHGLGLAMVHGIVRQSGGHLTVESEVGRGTCFRIYLPALAADAVPDATEAILAPEPMASPADSRRVLLLVEDEEPVRRLTERALTQRGWSVVTAESADDALALPSETLASIDVLVSDVVMPGTDGPALLRTLRQTRPDLPAVLMSGYAEETLRRELAESGATFLAKPYTLAGLEAALTEVDPPPLQP